MNNQESGVTSARVARGRPHAALTSSRRGDKRPSPSTRLEADSAVTEVLGDLVRLRDQLEVLAANPVVVGAYRMTAEVAPVLEPVWSILARPGVATDGVGFLRRPGGTDSPEETTQNNVDVIDRAIDAYRAIDLVAPSARDVWRAVARPARALLESVAAEPAGATSDHGQVATLSATVRPILPRQLLGAQGRDADVALAFRRVLRLWCELARHATGERGEAARLTLAAALLARGAVLDCDTDTVRWFIHRWLGLVPTDTRFDATCAALLEGGWVLSTVDEEFSAIRDQVTDVRIQAIYQKRLKIEVQHHYRLHRPVWETQLRGMPVALLSDPVSQRRTSQYEGTVTSLAETIADTTAETFDRVHIQEAVRAALQDLPPRDRAALVIYAAFDLTYEETGVTLGEDRKAVAIRFNRAARTLRNNPSLRNLVGEFTN